MTAQIAVATTLFFATLGGASAEALRLLEAGMEGLHGGTATFVVRQGSFTGRLG